MTDAFSIATLDSAPALERVPVTHESAWHGRRALGFGASDIAALFVGYDLRDPDTLGDKAKKNGKRFARGRWKLPRIVLEKAGAVAPLAMGEPADAGRVRERALVEQWRRRVELGRGGPDAELVDPTTILYVPDVIPIELIPIVDRVEPLLVVSPDVLARDVFGALGCWDTKCSVHAYSTKERGFDEHVLQLNAQYAACCGTHGGIVEGEGWSAKWKDHAGEPTGNVITHAIERDDQLIVEIRQVVRRAWDDVLSVRADMEET